MYLRVKSEGQTTLRANNRKSNGHESPYRRGSAIYGCHAYCWKVLVAVNVVSRPKVAVSVLVFRLWFRSHLSFISVHRLHFSRPPCISMSHLRLSQTQHVIAQPYRM